MEVAIAVAATALLVLTLITCEWIEILFGVGPDGGSGALERALAGGLAVVAAVSTAAALIERRRAAPTAA